MMLWGGALIGAVLGGLATMLLFEGVWCLAMRQWPCVATFLQTLATWRGIILGTGTGWALALIRSGQAGRAGDVLLWFGWIGVSLPFLTALGLRLILWRALERPAPSGGWPDLKTLWLFCDAGTLLWAAGLLWNGYRGQ